MAHYRNGDLPTDTGGRKAAFFSNLYSFNLALERQRAHLRRPRRARLAMPRAAYHIESTRPQAALQKSKTTTAPRTHAPHAARAGTPANARAVVRARLAAGLRSYALAPIAHESLRARYSLRVRVSVREHRVGPRRRAHLQTAPGSKRPPHAPALMRPRLPRSVATPHRQIGWIPKHERPRCAVCSAQVRIRAVARHTLACRAAARALRPSAATGARMPPASHFLRTAPRPLPPVTPASNPSQTECKASGRKFQARAGLVHAASPIPPCQGTKREGEATNAAILEGRRATQHGLQGTNSYQASIRTHPGTRRNRKQLAIHEIKSNSKELLWRDCMQRTRRKDETTDVAE
ncbi:hypothetical protein B0H17DRAFT_1179165 [Mycena rosella]|uniref:Uncharacterized protein n=1 Tax=Mycena rosella TaxID=1033263 RepID=A0AAD7GK42_MYCRO|nr:hypothetical protein B0H17DRAFT_1179165 [Mycena rosella]